VEFMKAPREIITEEVYRNQLLEGKITEDY